MSVVKEKNKCDRVIDMLPRTVADEVVRICRSRRAGSLEIREIHLRALGACSLKLHDETVRLISSPSPDDMADMVHRLSDGALYAQRESISSGYVSVEGGIRVGLVGTARYEGHGIVGISDIRYALFRFPSGECSFKDELVKIFHACRGMLIYSPPGVGKTTALRALASELGRGDRRLRVAVVDERFEFDPDDYLNSDVDILRGYKRREGIEIATRTMSPDVLLIDELGADDAAGISEVVRCGIPIVATAHASSIEELRSRKVLAPLFDCGAFDTYVGISRSGSSYELTVDKE
ncbi:MAG: AAA family ATPase [Clostridia bacterium]|nr:AAA family ATPase [Clostridia bacterium]